MVENSPNAASQIIVMLASGIASSLLFDVFSLFRAIVGKKLVGMVLDGLWALLSAAIWTFSAAYSFGTPVRAFPFVFALAGFGTGRLAGLGSVARRIAERLKAALHKKSIKNQNAIKTDL